jgi:hypothetical protein
MSDASSFDLGLSGPQSFSDLLNNTIRLVGKTWKTSLLVGGLAFLPGLFLLSVAYHDLFGTLGAVIGNLAHSGADALGALGRVYARFSVAMVIVLLLTLYVRACVFTHAMEAVAGRLPAVRETARRVFQGFYLRLILQRLLILIILTGIAVGGGVVATIAGVTLSLVSAPGALAGAVIALVVGAALALALWLSVRYSVALEALIADDLKPSQSLGASMALVAGNWWRVLGRTLLFGIMVAFAVSVASFPVVGVAVLPAYARMFEQILAEGGAVPDFADILPMYASMSTGLAVAAYLQSLLAGFVSPVFMGLLYLDLGARSVASEDSIPPYDATQVPDDETPPPEEEPDGEGWV